MLKLGLKFKIGMNLNNLDPVTLLQNLDCYADTNYHRL